MKKLILILLSISLFSSAGFAQFSRPVSIGLGAGSTFNLTDLANVEPRFAAHLEVEGLLTPFISIGLKGEKGMLSGNGYASEFENNYFGLQAAGKIRLGQFLSLPENYSYYTLQAGVFQRALSNIYVGVGAGLIKNSVENSISTNYRQAVMNQNGEISDDLTGMQFVIPIHIGIDVPLGKGLYGPQWAINLNYQHSISTKDNLDGIINQQNDHYGYLSLGVKYALFQRK